MPTLSGERITKRILDTLSGRDREYAIWDAEVRCFGVRIKPRGTKSFVVKYRNDLGRQRKVTLGQFGHLTVEEARKLAKQHLGRVAAGEDHHRHNLLLKL